MKKSLISILILSFVFFVGTVFAQSPIAIEGPQKSEVGQLCVFSLTDENAVADWTVVPPTEFYIDKCGQTLVFATPKAAKYTIVAATIFEEKPLVLTFTCDYGVTPSPNPDPDPKPDPDPEPQPEPKTIRDWVMQNIPAEGQKDVLAIAKCYDDAASSMERGTIRTIDAGYAGVRMCSQSKANVKIWGTFFDTLGEKVTTELGQSTNTRDLAKIFREIAGGLRGDSEVKQPENPGTKSQVPENCPTGNCPVR